MYFLSTTLLSGLFFCDSMTFKKNIWGKIKPKFLLYRAAHVTPQLVCQRQLWFTLLAQFLAFILI